ncbi:hypothetical protein D3C71_1203830 [compost metagenome]
MQVAARPQGGRCIRVVQVALGKPGRAHHHFAGGQAIVGDVCHRRVDDAKIHQRHRDAGLGAQRQHLLRIVQGIHVDLGDGQQRAGLGHAVAAKNVDAAGQCPLRQRPRKGRTANDHLPVAQVGVGTGRVLEQHMQDGRYAMREGHLLARDQRQQPVRQIAAGVDLLDAHQRGQVGQAPGMHVEHRGDRHVDVAAVQAALAGRTAERGHRRQRVQHQLPVAEEHALGQAGSPGGIEHRGAAVLIEVREAGERRRRAQPGLVLGRETGRQRAGNVLQQDPRAHLRQLPADAVQHGQEVAVDQDHLRAAVVQCVGDLLRCQADVHRHQHRADNRHGEVALQITVAVPVHHRHGIAVPDPQRGQQARQLADARVQCAVVEANGVGVDDLLIRVHRQRREQQLFDQQRKGLGLGGR